MCRIDLMLQDLKKCAEDSLALAAAIDRARGKGVADEA